jgi:hypothetical protein
MSARDVTPRKPAVDKRWDKAIDRILNSGLMYPYMDDFWRYIDGKITFEQFSERMSP